MATSNSSIDASIFEIICVYAKNDMERVVVVSIDANLNKFTIKISYLE